MVLICKNQCMVCCTEIPSVSKRFTRGKYSVRDFFELVGISFASFQATWTSTSEDEPVDLGFCINCEALILRGLELKKQLCEIKDNLILNSVQSSWELNGSSYEDISGSLNETERYRVGVWRLLKQCFSECEIRIQKADEDGKLPGLGRVYPEEPTVCINDDAGEPGSPASCRSGDANSFEGADYDPLDFELPTKRRKCTLNVNYSTEPAVEKIDDGEDNDFDGSWASDNDEPSDGDGEDYEQNSKAEKRAKTSSTAGTSKKKKVESDAGTAASNSFERRICKQEPREDLEGFKCNECSMTCFSAEILAVHVQEIHENLDETQLTFTCPTCKMYVNAETYMSKSKFVESQGYMCEITSVQRLIYFDYFYELCEFHYVKCLRNSIHLTPLHEDENMAEILSKVTTVMTASELNVDGDFHYYRPCVLCSKMFSSSGLKIHYWVKHNLKYFIDDRFACLRCKQVYTGNNSGNCVGKLVVADLEHFKGFVSEHKTCNRKLQPTALLKCTECASDFELPERLFSHSIHVHHTADKYKCERCDFRTSNLIYLKRHARRMHGLRLRIHCARCLQHFPRHDLYVKHLANHFPNVEPSSTSSRILMEGEQKPGYLKPVANRELAYLGKTQGKERQRRMKTNKCCLCDEAFFSSDLTQLHLQEEHDDQIGDPLTFNCFECKKTFSQADYASPDADGTFKYPPYTDSTTSIEFATFWEFCNHHIKICINEPALRYYQRRYRQRKAARLNLKSQPPYSPRLYGCKKCGEKFTKESSLLSHLPVHYAPLLKQCMLCAFGGKDMQQVQNHVVNAHSINAGSGEHYYCMKCFTFFDSGRPELHVGQLLPEDVEKFKEFAAEHSKCCTSDRPALVPCTVCGKGFKGPSAFITHQRGVHRKPQSRCFVCDLDFGSEEAYNSHLPECKAAAKRIYKCDVCPYKTPREYLLKIHMQGHADKREFICEVCGKGFNAEPQLKKHKVLHEEGGNVLCPLCGKMFQRKHNLHNHIYCFHQRRRPPKKSKAPKKAEGNAA